MTNFNFAFTVAEKNVWHPHTVDIEGYLEWDIQKFKWTPLDVEEDLRADGAQL